MSPASGGSVRDGARVPRAPVPAIDQAADLGGGRFPCR